jgi:Arc/MetJ-type ribon-helix-helix transcriptional regulator
MAEYKRYIFQAVADEAELLDKIRSHLAEQGVNANISDCIRFAIRLAAEQISKESK